LNLKPVLSIRRAFFIFSDKYADRSQR